MTIPELLVAASIMILVLSIALPFLVTIHIAWDDNEDRSTALDGARAATVFVGKAIRSGRRFSNVPSPSDQQGSLQFEVPAPDGTVHQYNYYFDTTGAPPGLGWVKLLETDLATGDTVEARVAGPVQSLSFDVRKADGIAPASHPWEARFVRVSAVGATGEGESTFPIATSTLRRGSVAPCALFCGGNLSLAGSTDVTGDIYAGGDLVIGAQASVTDGLAYAAGTVVGNGAVVGASPTPAPTLPALDQTYYTDLLALAQSEPNGDLDKNADVMDLAGGTVYVHGFVMLRGTSELRGPGTFVATHDFLLADNARITGAPHIIVGRTARFDDTSQMIGGGVVYAVDYIDLDGTTSVEADMVTPALFDIDAGEMVEGIVYAGQGDLRLGTIRGATYIGSAVAVDGVTFEADAGVLFHTVPGLQLSY
jgi:hypothetical protein